MTEPSSCACCRTMEASDIEEADLDHDDLDHEEFDPADLDEADLDSLCDSPLHDVIEDIRKQYSMGIIVILGEEGPLRQSELSDRLDVTSASSMVDRLKLLQADGLISRKSYDEVPPHVEYALTEQGHELAAHLKPLDEEIEAIFA